MGGWAMRGLARPIGDEVCAPTRRMIGVRTVGVCWRRPLVHEGGCSRRPILSEGGWRRGDVIWAGLDDGRVEGDRGGVRTGVRASRV